MKKILLLSLGMFVSGCGIMNAMEKDLATTVPCLVPGATSNFLTPGVLTNVISYVGSSTSYSNTDCLEKGKHYLVRDAVLNTLFLTFVIQDVTPEGFPTKFYKHTLDGVNTWISPSNSFIATPGKYTIQKVKGFEQKCQQRQEQKQLALQFKKIKQCKTRK